MNESKWPPEVALLLELGPVGPSEQPSDWLDYRELGLSAEYAPALIELATDMELNQGDQDEASTWGPLHAWRALGQLHHVEALPSLIDLQNTLDDYWLVDDLQHLCLLFGPRSLPVLESALGGNGADDPAGAPVIFGLEAIGKKYPETRRECIRILSQALEQYEQLSHFSNGELIYGLVELRGKSALPLIAQAFAADQVHGMMINWETVQEAFRLHRNTTPEDVLAQQATG